MLKIKWDIAVVDPKGEVGLSKSMAVKEEFEAAGIKAGPEQDQGKLRGGEWELTGLQPTVPKIGSKEHQSCRILVSITN